jgi:signal transduction histidine kinase
VPERRRDEAGELARQFNQMAARLQESFATISADRDRLRAFVADVSHELRTPLTALRTFNDLLQNGAGEDPATRRDFLAESARQIERLDWLTHNLLDLSRLDAGLTRVVPCTADLAATLRHALDTNAPAAAARGVSLVLEADALLVPHDPPRLEQAFSNVVSNAIKFSPRGGTVRAHLRAAGERAVVEIDDEGPGIPPEEAPHIFERFYRGRDANRAGEGSGLGLSIARAILDAHGGAISVESTPGQGTIMRLTLPLSPARDSALAVGSSQ